METEVKQYHSVATYSVYSPFQWAHLKRESDILPHRFQNHDYLNYFYGYRNGFLGTKKELSEAFNFVKVKMDFRSTDAEWLKAVESMAHDTHSIILYNAKNTVQLSIPYNVTENWLAQDALPKKQRNSTLDYIFRKDDPNRKRLLDDAYYKLAVPIESKHMTHQLIPRMDLYYDEWYTAIPDGNQCKIVLLSYDVREMKKELPLTYIIPNIKTLKEAEAIKNLIWHNSEDLGIVQVSKVKNRARTKDYCVLFETTYNTLNSSNVLENYKDILGYSAKDNIAQSLVYIALIWDVIRYDAFIGGEDPRFSLTNYNDNYLN